MAVAVAVGGRGRGRGSHRQAVKRRKSSTALTKREAAKINTTRQWDGSQGWERLGNKVDARFPFPIGVLYIIDIKRLIGNDDTQ